MVVVPNYQTMGTLFVGVMTSVATWFMFGYRSPSNEDPTHAEEENLYSYLSQQRSFGNQLRQHGNRIYKNALEIPDSMYPRQTELCLVKKIDYSIDQILLVSAHWIPRHSFYLKLVIWILIISRFCR